MSASKGRRSSAEAPAVFVSSTYLDNVGRREWVREAIERAGMRPVAMERWTAHELPAREMSLEHVAEADVFVGILAWRYGWIPDGAGKSITELEYDEAGRLGLPRLIFVIDQQLRDVNIAIDFDADDPWRKQQLLDEFKKRASTEQTALPFAKGEDLRAFVMQALFEWKERRAAEAGEARPAEPVPFEPLQPHEQTLADYLQAVEAEHAHVVLPGFEQRLRVPLLLDDLFVPVNITFDRGRDPETKDADRYEAGADATPTLPGALAALSADTRRKGVVLLGHPGSGKTTQLRRLALSLARGRQADVGLAGDLVPVFVPLRKLLPTDDSLATLAQRLIADRTLGFDDAFAAWLWKRGRLLLLIDGLDEVPKERRGQVKEWIEVAARRRKGDVLVVSCRHEGYTRSAHLGPEFLGLSLLPLTNEQADTVVQRWHEAVAVGLLPKDAAARDRNRAASTAADDSAALIARLHDGTMRATHVYELAHNPLLLSAICLVHRDRGKLPDRAAELYADTIDVLLQHWREAKRLPITFEARSARQVLQPVALWLHEKEGRTQASEDALCEVLQPAFAAAGWRDLTPRSFLATVRDESGLLTGWSAETFGFMHLGFQEYLAARELHQRILRRAGDATAFRAEIDAALKHFGHTWWDEVVSLLFAVDDGGVLFAPLVAALLRHERLVGNEALARQCLADARRFSADPLRELLRLPADDGFWPNRLVAARQLLARGEQAAEAADVAPALELLDRPPGRRAALHEEQFTVARLVELLAPASLVERAEQLAQHPHEGLSALARSVLARTSATRAAVKTSTDATKGRVVSAAQRVVAPRGGCELVLVPGGKFLMGSPATEAGRFEYEGPQHEVQVEPFYLAVHPVTNEQYARFLAATPDAREPGTWGDRNFNQPRQPVVGVSWDDARAYCKWAGLLLPTEAQWEHACRAGTQTPYWSGDDEKDLEHVGWYAKNSESRLHAVGEKPANPFGLVDMHGNVWEWCEDDWSRDYSESKAAHPQAYKEKGAGLRVVRGGAFSRAAGSARSACRGRNLPSDRYGRLGFRPAMGITTS